MLTFKEIKNILNKTDNLSQISSIKELKKTLKLNEEEYQRLLDNASSSTDDFNPKESIYIKIQLPYIDKEGEYLLEKNEEGALDIDLLFKIKNIQYEDGKIIGCDLGDLLSVNAN